MPDYSLNEIVHIILILGECHNNYRQAAVLYCNRFPHREHPNHCMISSLVLRQKRQRCINIPKRDDLMVLAVLEMIAINPRVSTRQIERELGIPKSTSHRILTTHNFHPYHVTTINTQ